MARRDLRVELVKHLAEQGGVTGCCIAADTLGLKLATVERMVRALANAGLVTWLSYGMDEGHRYTELSLTPGMAAEVSRYGAEWTMDMVAGGAVVDPRWDDATERFGCEVRPC